MSNSRRIFCRIPESLLIEYRQSKRISGKDHDHFLIHLTKIERPKNYQDEYKPFYNGDSMRSLSLFVSNDAFIDFMTFSAVFKNYYHAFDYLIFTEKSTRIGRVIN